MTSFLKKEWKFITIIIMVILVFAISMILIFTLNGKEKYKEKVDDGTYKFKTTLKVDYDDHQSNMKVENQGGIPIYFGKDPNGGGHKDEIGGGQKYESGWISEDEDQIIYGGGGHDGYEWEWIINYRTNFTTFKTYKY